MAVDGSLIFNTKIDTSGLNSDIAKINKAIAKAQNKAQSGARQTAQTAKQQADKSAQAAENSAKREITATQEKVEQAQNSAKQTTQAAEKAAQETADKVSKSSDEMSQSVSGATGRIGSDTENMADDIMNSSDFITMAVKAVTRALTTLDDTAKKIANAVGQAVAFSAKTVAQGIGTMLGATGKFTLKQFIGDYENQGSGINKLLLAAGSYFSLYKLFDFSKEGIELGSDLAEVQNVVDVTFSHMSASVDDWAKSAQNAYGLSETMAKKYVGTFGSMAEAFGFTEQQAFDMSTSLTALTGDVAPFYNITQDEAYTKLKSVFSGETETLKDLGIVMTQNALDNYAMANGWGKTTSAMTEAEKVTLRYNFVLDQLSNATGDFARTQDSWANQTRILQLRWQTLLSTIGKALINIFTPVLQVLNTVLDRLQSVASWFENVVTAVFGNSSASSGALSDGLNELSDSAGNAADNINDTSKAVEELQNNLSSFDELNVMSDTSESNSSTDLASQVNDALLASGIIKDIVSDTIKPVEDLKVDKVLIESIKKGRWQKVGLILAQKLKKALTKIPWSEIQNSAVIIAKNIGGFINGALEDKTVWEEVGRAIAEGLNTAFKFLLTLLQKINWEDLGKAMAEMLNGFLDEFNAETFGTMLAERVNAIFDTLYGFVSKLDWGLLGSKLAQSLLAYFRGLHLTEEGEGAKIPEAIAGIINGIVQAGIALFTYTDPETGENIWAYIGKVLGQGLSAFLQSFKINDAVELVKDSLNALIKLIYNAFVEVSKDDGFKKLGEDIADGVNNWLDDDSWWSEMGKMFNEIINDILDMVISFIEHLDIGAINKAFTSFFSEIDWDTIFGKVGYLAVTALAKAIALFLDKVSPFIDQFFSFFSIFDFNVGSMLKNEYKGLLNITMGEDFTKMVYGSLDKSVDHSGGGRNFCNKIGEGLADGMHNSFIKLSTKNKKLAQQQLESATGDLIGSANKKIQEDNSVSTTLESKGKKAQNATINAFDKGTIVKHFSDVLTAIKGVFSSVGTFFQNTFGNAWNRVKNIFSDKSGITNIKKSVESVFKNCLNNLISGFNSAISSPFVSLNQTIDTLRKFKFANLTPFSWIPKISYPQIPKLATGAYVPANYGEFLAVLGDNKREPEVVSPISAMKQAMAEVLAEYGGMGNGGDIHITLTMPDGRVLFEAVADENNKIKKRTGRSAFA